MKGLDGLREEVAAFASSEAGQVRASFSDRTAGEELSECLEYVLDGEAGSTGLCFQSGLQRDCDASGHRLPERTTWEGGHPRGKRLQVNAPSLDVLHPGPWTRAWTMGLSLDPHRPKKPWRRFHV